MLKLGFVIKIEILFVVCITAMVVSCGTSRSLNENNLTFKANKVVVQDKKTNNNKPSESNLKKLTVPKPNTKLFGFIPLKRAVYNLAGDSVPEKGLRHWMKYKYGEKPVMIKQYHIDNSITQIQSGLINTGIFDYSVETSRQIKNNKVKVIYYVKTTEPFYLNKIHFPDSVDQLTGALKQSRIKSKLKQGDRFSLKALKEERTRIESELGEQGFYAFNRDNIIFRLDTIKEKKLVNISLVPKDDLPGFVRKKYYIHNIHVHHYAKPRGDTIDYDTLQIDNIVHICDKSNMVKPSVLRRSVTFNKKTLYKKSTYDNTLNRLSSLGVYSFVNIFFNEFTQNDTSFLDVEIYLTPRKPRSVRTELQFLSKSNDFTGPGVKISYNDRNLWQGAEQFIFAVNGNYETQFSDGNRKGETYEIGSNVELNIPRFVTPFFNANKYVSKKYTPQTRINLGYSVYNRKNYLKLYSVNSSFGYVWKETAFKTHNLELISLSYLKLADLSELAEQSIGLKDEARERFILGLEYAYTVNNLMLANRFRQYLRTTVELAGNTLSAVSPLFNAERKADSIPYELFGIQYSQFARLSLDLRSHIMITENTSFAGRLFGGVVIAYGNKNIPYNRKYFAGGSSGLRGFVSHSVGPGTYQQQANNINAQFEQVGDMKLEANAEFRFKLSKILNGAAFIDAGNVWLLEKNNELLGGEFNASEFLNELAINNGVGLRLDIQFVVLRLDVAFPIRLPYLPQDERWVIKDINFSSKKWRENNLVFNLAIGYPF